MRRDELTDLAAFMAVADARSFTRAASRLGVSASALSHAMRGLEGRLGVRLLARTTRSVRATAAGERLLESLRPALEGIAAGLAALGGPGGTPAGTVRVSAPRHAAQTVLLPALPRLRAAYPAVRVEVAVEEGLTDLVAGRFDAGMRFGGGVAPGMVAVGVGAAVQVAVVGAPGHFATHPPPGTPDELVGHPCINYRLATAGGLWPWEFVRDGRTFSVRVEGPLVFNDGGLILGAALAGGGLAYLFADEVAGHVAAGRLVRVLEGWCPRFPGYQIYYPGRRQVPAALAALVEVLRVGAG